MTSQSFPFGEPIQVITRTVSGEDREGNDEWSETSVTYTGAFDPAIGYESTGLQDQASTQPQVYLPFDAVVTPRSAVIVRGMRFEVDGFPAYWSNPFVEHRPGVQVPLKLVTG